VGQVNPVTLVVILAIAGLGAILCVLEIHYQRNRRRVRAIERWAVTNGWSFSREAVRDPPWAPWSPAMVASQVSRLQLSGDFMVKDVGPVLTSVVDGIEVSLACVRWTLCVDDQGGSTSPYTASLFAAIHVAESLPSMTVRRWPSFGSQDRDRFAASFRVTPEEAQARIPEALKEAHLSGEVWPWTVHDGCLVTICRHQRHDYYPLPEQLLPAARLGLRLAQLLTESFDRPENSAPSE
jgi:hypothetical protein